MQVAICAVVLAVGYLLGSVNAAVIISGSILGGDVREKGSHNAGAANMARVYGAKAGVFVFALDFIKTAVAMGIGFLLMSRYGVALAGVACEVGHCWPVYFNFKGGKGVTVAWAVAMFIDWRAGLLLVPVYLLTFAVKRTASISSLVAVAFFPVFTLLMGDPIYVTLLAVFTACMVWLRHIDNIRRIIRGEEESMTFKKP